MNDEHYAKEAQRLLTDDVLAEAMTNVRLSALTRLATVDASNTNEILRLQAIANCLEDVKGELEAMILRTGSSGFVPEQPPG